MMNVNHRIRVFRFKDVAGILPFDVGLQGLLVLAVSDPLGINVEELRKLLLCVIGGVADITRILAEERHLGAFRRDVVLVDEVAASNTERLFPAFSLVGVAADVVLRVGNHEVNAPALERVRYATAGEIGVSEQGFRRCSRGIR